ncbi:hypothetical protein U0C82_15110 [Fulvimarina sp. 2208YS6-2-32]|uniref:Uncharacterized protein n=1 Tax=Fulvimarina uroteuthidis TaxID=3098149 RepID=A0ABU5I5S9_9HYPH|nr:hypothetical protein [Fulvimarina sp. 2208YS6-2-32]MDY8110470.1 hypothetical protein [Fulvimarina sp. 2208YS6-2-32]
MDSRSQNPALHRRVIGFVATGLRTFLDARSGLEITIFTVYALACVGFAVLTALLVAPYDARDYGPVENGYYELIQAGILAVTALLFFTALIRFRRELFYFAAIVTFVSVLAMTRETPVCDSAFYESGPCFSANGKTMLILATGLIVLCALAIKREPFARRWSELNFFYAVPVALTVLFLLASAMFETMINVWLEEMSEMSAYLNLLGLAVILNVRPQWFDRQDRDRASGVERNHPDKVGQAFGNRVR